MIKVGILGAAGYTGGELIRLLLNHPQAEIVFANSESNAGNSVSDLVRMLWVHLFVHKIYPLTEFPFQELFQSLTGINEISGKYLCFQLLILAACQIVLVCFQSIHKLWQLIFSFHYFPSLARSSLSIRSFCGVSS